MVTKVGTRATRDEQYIWIHTNDTTDMEEIKVERDFLKLHVGESLGELQLQTDTQERPFELGDILLRAGDQSILGVIIRINSAGTKMARPFTVLSADGTTSPAPYQGVQKKNCRNLYAADSKMQKVGVNDRVVFVHRSFGRDH